MKFGLIGRSLQHSFSKTFFESNYSNSISYNNYEIENIELLPSFLNQQADLSGFNVTLPYKKSVIKYLHECEKEAEEIGSVNVVSINRNENGQILKLKGYNTDYLGFIYSIKPYIKAYHGKAIILGTGGGSSAVKFGLKTLGIESVCVSRDPASVHEIDYRSIDKKLLDEHLLIINTTPVGMYPDIYSAPDLNYELLTTRHFLFDLIYNPEETEFIKLGRMHGATVMNGYDMLIKQAELSLKIWEKDLEFSVQKNK